MSLSSKSKFAIIALLVIATSQRGLPVSLQSISQQRNISVSTLEMLFKQLRQQGIVVAKRGPNGGYILQRCASLIYIGDIARLFQKVRATDCQATNDLLHIVNQHIFKLLDGLTLQSLIKDKSIDPQTSNTFPNLRRGIYKKAVEKKHLPQSSNWLFAIHNSPKTQSED